MILFGVCDLRIPLKTGNVYDGGAMLVITLIMGLVLEAGVGEDADAVLYID